MDNNRTRLSPARSIETHIGCASCGYDHYGQQLDSVCPECGKCVLSSVRRSVECADRWLIACLFVAVLSLLLMSLLHCVTLLMMLDVTPVAEASLCAVVCASLAFANLRAGGSRVLIAHFSLSTAVVLICAIWPQVWAVPDWAHRWSVVIGVLNTVCFISAIGGVSYLCVWWRDKFSQRVLRASATLLAAGIPLGALREILIGAGLVENLAGLSGVLALLLSVCLCLVGASAAFANLIRARNRMGTIDLTLGAVPTRGSSA